MRTDKLKSVATDATTALTSRVSSLLRLERLAKQIELSANGFASNRQTPTINPTAYTTEEKQRNEIVNNKVRYQFR